MTVNLINTYAVTPKGGFFHAQALTGYSTGGWQRRRVAKALATRALLPLREMMITLNGATAGSAALVERTRIAAATPMGGVRTIETETLLDVNSAAADVTTINDDILSYNSYDSTPVVNGDANPRGYR